MLYCRVYHLYFNGAFLYPAGTIRSLRTDVSVQSPIHTEGTVFGSETLLAIRALKTERRVFCVRLSTIWPHQQRQGDHSDRQEPSQATGQQKTATENARCPITFGFQVNKASSFSQRNMSRVLQAPLTHVHTSTRSDFSCMSHVCNI